MIRKNEENPFTEADSSDGATVVIGTNFVPDCYEAGWGPVFEQAKNRVLLEVYL
jgi:hypothetical protein